MHTYGTYTTRLHYLYTVLHFPPRIFGSESDRDRLLAGLEVSVDIHLDGALSFKLL